MTEVNPALAEQEQVYPEPVRVSMEELHTPEFWGVRWSEQAEESPVYDYRTGFSQEREQSRVRWAEGQKISEDLPEFGGEGRRSWRDELRSMSNGKLALYVLKRGIAVGVVAAGVYAALWYTPSLIDSALHSVDKFGVHLLVTAPRTYVAGLGNVLEVGKAVVTGDPSGVTLGEAVGGTISLGISAAVGTWGTRLVLNTRRRLNSLSKNSGGE